MTLSSDIINNHQHFVIANKWVCLQKVGADLKSGIEVKEVSDSISNISEIGVFSIDR